MARTIPEDFDVYKEELDPNELIIRDRLKIKIDNWAKFRYSIYAGNDSTVLDSNEEIDLEVRRAFLELAKSHYEGVNCLGYAKQSMDSLLGYSGEDASFHFNSSKTLKEFYIHLGSLFDNLAKLIYILNCSDSANQRIRNRLVRHWIDWPQLSREFRYAQYESILDDPTLKEILLLRNNVIHNWRPSIVGSSDGQRYLYIEIREDRNYLWPYEEKAEFLQKYTQLKPLGKFLQDDFSFVERRQNEIFGQLIIDLLKFEKNYNVCIRNG